MKIAFLRRFRRQQQHSRSFVRFECQIDTSITLIERAVGLEGRVFDLSRGGALFRPKLAYIMRRHDEPICIKVGGEELFGHIVSTSPKGFSLRFDEPIDENVFARMVDDLHLDATKTAA